MRLNLINIKCIFKWTTCYLCKWNEEKRERTSHWKLMKFLSIFIEHVVYINKKTILDIAQVYNHTFNGRFINMKTEKKDFAWVLNTFLWLYNLMLTAAYICRPYICSSVYNTFLWLYNLMLTTNCCLSPTQQIFSYIMARTS